MEPFYYYKPGSRSAGRERSIPVHRVDWEIHHIDSPKAAPAKQTTKDIKKQLTYSHAALAHKNGYE
jgi:hypothetical protein